MSVSGDPKVELMGFIIERVFVLGLTSRSSG